MTCPDCNHPRGTLPDGTVTCTWSEAWRVRCEALTVCKIPTLTARREYLSGVWKKRGEHSYLELKRHISQLWQSAQSEVVNTDSQ